MLAESKAAVTIVLAVTLLSACTAIYDDVTSNPRHAKHLGQVCATTRELQAQGVAVEYERARGTSYVVVTEPLAFRSYTTFARPIRSGTKFKVLRVRQCANCPFDDVVQFQVEFEFEPAEFEGKPVYLTTPELEQVAACREP